MINVEKAVLATCISFPNLLPVLFDNCMREDFSASEHQIIYETLLKLHEERQTIDNIIIFDLIGGKITKGYLLSVMEECQALPASMAESWLIDKLSVMKSRSAKVNGIRACLVEFEAPMPDFDRIIQIAESGKVIETSKEDPSFDVAYSEYLDWKNKDKTNINTGFPTFDRQIDGLNYGELFGVMGRTATAKTWMSINILNSLITKTKDKIGYFSLEMSRATFMERMKQVYFKLSRHEVWDKTQSGTLNVAEFKKTYSDLNIYGRVYSVADISRLVERDKIKIVFVDFLQLIKKTRGKSIYENVSYQIEELKAMAKNKDCVIFLLIQLSRKGEGGWVPVSIDMARDSGTIEENCDFIIGVWSPILHPDINIKDEEYWRGKLAVKLLKNKRGITIQADCLFNTTTGVIGEIGKHWSDSRDRQEGHHDNPV